MTTPRPPSMITRSPPFTSAVRLPRPTDGRDAHRAGHDSGVARSAADVDGEPLDVGFIQSGRLARQQVVGDDDHFLRQVALNPGASARSNSSARAVRCRRHLWPARKSTDRSSSQKWLAYRRVTTLTAYSAVLFCVLISAWILADQRAVPQDAHVEVEDAADVFAVRLGDLVPQGGEFDGALGDGGVGGGPVLAGLRRPWTCRFGMSSSSVSSTIAVPITTPAETPMPFLISIAFGPLPSGPLSIAGRRARPQWTQWTMDN